MTATLKHRSSAVCRLAGLSPLVLRMWERRYGPIARVRSSGGARLYDDDDVARLKLVRQLVDEGHAVGEVIRLDLPALRAQIEHGAGQRFASTDELVAIARERFIDAAMRLDVDGAARVLAQAGLALDPIGLIERFAAPIMVELGRAWGDGRASVAVEHAATAVVRAHFEPLLRTDVAASSTRKRCLATTPSGELHELGALFAAVVASCCGWGVHYLGASLPAAEIVRAAVKLRVDAVLVSTVSLDEEAAVREVRAIAAQLPEGCALVVGGAVTNTMATVERVVVARDLRKLVALLEMLDSLPVRRARRTSPTG